MGNEYQQSLGFQPKITIIGLGYVGLPLAIALSHHFSVIGFDINATRIQELKAGYDRTNEISAEKLQTSTLKLTYNIQEIKQQDIYIVTVPTPVTHDHLPDLLPLQKASETVGSVLEKNAIVVYESTVYPGVTEDFCGPILERLSGLKAGKDFFLGYSPERINPGDTEHTVERITKVVSGQTPEIAEKLKQMYGAVNKGNIFIAANIKTAEAAKVIENAQRDINIAFINEIAIIVGKLGLSVYDVLEAASTKWNFLNFKPGLVGGHCIGVDPYYLAYCARKLHHEPDVLLAGRRTNENMGPYLAKRVNDELLALGITAPARILILGITFKEDIPDLRNTKVIDVINQLKDLGHTVDVHDTQAHAEEAEKYLGLKLLKTFKDVGNYDCVIGAVPHKAYLALSAKELQKLLKPKGLIADFKNIWPKIVLPKDLHYWSI